jgi:hypothetical protein
MADTGLQEARPRHVRPGLERYPGRQNYPGRRRMTSRATKQFIKRIWRPEHHEKQSDRRQKCVVERGQTLRAAAMVIDF